MILLTPSTNSHKSPYWKRCVFLPAADRKLILFSVTSKHYISSTDMICRFLEYYFLSSNPFVLLIIHLFLNNYFWWRSDFVLLPYFILNLTIWHISMQLHADITVMETKERSRHGKLFIQNLIKELNRYCSTWSI